MKRFVLVVLLAGCGSTPVVDAGVALDAGGSFDAGVDAGQLDAGPTSCPPGSGSFNSSCSGVGPPCGCSTGASCACGFQCIAQALDYLRTQCSCGTNAKLACANVALPSGACEGGEYCNVVNSSCTAATGDGGTCTRECTCGHLTSAGSGRFQCVDTCGPAGSCPSTTPSGSCSSTGVSCRYATTSVTTGALSKVTCSCASSDGGATSWSCN